MEYLFEVKEERMRDISKLSAERQRKILDYVGKEIAEGLIDSVNKKNETTLRSVITITDEQINILKENGISLTDVAYEIEKAQRKVLYKFLSKDDLYKEFYEYIKQLIKNGNLEEKIVRRKFEELERRK